ncbi:hypothetical protein Halru_0384 [Halovivax ruber XH-70]|uniref:Uncharacterized protein n=1 Tax=Halovivax ruber (strain DSM 18193 / JCM 13892 / XH-70) TaxID=797302 RepID=L0IAP2_HALRX|nr:hypothetical protein [Halovivax ruber]AGB15027.1 hypothetical protein Halru_0384 [Halovivax ruber XH-70]
MATVETVLSSIFSTIPELHAGQLGLLAGIIVGLLYWHGFQRESLGLLTGFYLLALGIVPASTTGLAVVQVKPWYFCTLLVGATLAAICVRSLWCWLPLPARSRSSSPVGQREF